MRAGQLRDAAYRARAGLISVLSSCICTFPIEQHSTSTGHRSDCTAHYMLLCMFTCPKCHAVSYNPHDREYGYCARCNAFTGDPPTNEVLAEIRAALQVVDEQARGAGSARADRGGQ